MSGATMTLESWGWDADWAAHLDALGFDSAEAARVVGQDRDRWTVRTRSRQAAARLTTGMRVNPYPVVGDWVVVEPGPMPSDPLSIVGVLPRRTAFVRGDPDDATKEHVLAANADFAWIVHGLDSAINHRRIERYLAVAWESGALPAIVLTKADLIAEPDDALAEARKTAIGVDVSMVSTEDPESVARLRAGLAPGRTVVLLGPSGAGKSTLVNLLAEAELAATGDVRASDRKGRHTTTRRELFQIGGGALLLDTPGLRALRVRELAEGLDRAFPEIEELSRECRFRDCRHEAEPECAVLAAVDAGRLPDSRLASFRKLVAEAAYEARKSDPRAKAAAVSEYKTAIKTMKKHHPKYGRTSE